MKPFLWKTSLPFMVAILCLLPVYGPAWAGDADELTKQAGQVFGTLPRIMASDKNPVTPEKVGLGKMLFYETRISVDGTVSCSKCHLFNLYATDGLRKAIGNQCKPNPRNSPTILNAAAQIAAHWIGNRTGVEDQAKQSVIGPPSFGMPSYEAVENKLKEISGYIPLFKEAFPKDQNPVTVDNFALAVGAFERTLVTPSPFDAFLAGDEKSITARQKKGLKAFMAMGCISCHAGAYAGGRSYEKFGVSEPYWKYTKSQAIDQGRFDVTKNEADKYVFKVPVLRNAARTAPYFHDGSVDELETAILIMGKVQLGRDLSQDELGDINAFLQSLTGRIPDDALKVPLLPGKE